MRSGVVVAALVVCAARAAQPGCHVAVLIGRSELTAVRAPVGTRRKTRACRTGDGRAQGVLCRTIGVRSAAAQPGIHHTGGCTRETHGGISPTSRTVCANALTGDRTGEPDRTVCGDGAGPARLDDRASRLGVRAILRAEAFDARPCIHQAVEVPRSAIDVQRAARRACSSGLGAVLWLVPKVGGTRGSPSVVSAVCHARLVGGPEAEVADLTGRAGRFGFATHHALSIVEVGRQGLAHGGWCRAVLIGAALHAPAGV
jgi:hypothetical protein